MQRIDYFKIYEKLYRLGYHARLKNHGQKYVKTIVLKYKFKSILEIGCSNGIAVKKFKKSRKLSYGIDVSDIATRYAAEKVLVPNCIISSATDIPFKDKFVEAAFSCDCLEHLYPEDVPKAIREIVRVTSKYIFAVLDFETERNREYLDKAKKEWPEDFKNIDNLHLTIWDKGQWIKAFSRCGAKYIMSHDDLMVFTVEN